MHSDIAAISALINSTYPANIDAEAALWRRCAKVSEEAGEVTEALLGMLGENPRKGYTHTESDVIHELLDVALAALGACAHIRPDMDTAAALACHATTRLARLRAVTDATSEARP